MQWLSNKFAPQNIAVSYTLHFAKNTYSVYLFIYLLQLFFTILPTVISHPARDGKWIAASGRVCAGCILKVNDKQRPAYRREINQRGPPRSTILRGSLSILLSATSESINKSVGTRAQLRFLALVQHFRFAARVHDSSHRERMNP